MVRELTKLWDGKYKESPYLKSISIDDGNKLRGIKKSKLEFAFPVTVLCGPNGTGKTTFLVLSLLAFHDDTALTLPTGMKSYFDFKYFFGFSEKEKHPEGIRVAWEYTDDTSDSFSKGRERWMRYIKNDKTPRRPIRGTEFVGLSRIVPSFEKRGFQKEFYSFKKQNLKSSTNDLESLLNRIMSKPYQSVQSYEKKNYAGTFRLNDYQSHTSFNAGAGEECLTYILDTLLTAKEGSIITIEEIEIGLHPSIMENLVDTILEIVLKRKLQVIITTHSPEFLRSCPKESLILAARLNDQVIFTHMPNVENAVYSLAGKANTELFIVCEDEWAAALINAMLTKKEKNTISIKGYGGDCELLSKAKAINAATNKKVLIIWDGDKAGLSQFQKFQNTENIVEKSSIGAATLPSGGAPEEYLKTILLTDETCKEKIKEEYNLDSADWQSLKDRLSTLSDNHDLFFVLAETLSADRYEAGCRICRIVQKIKEDDFSEIKKVISELHAGTIGNRTKGI